MLQLTKIKWYHYPFFISHEIHLQVVKAEHHGQLFSILRRITITVLQRSTGHFPHRDNLGICPESSFIQLLQILVDIRSICIESSPVPFKIIPEFSLADQVYHIKPEPLDAFSHPELYYILDPPPHFR